MIITCTDDNDAYIDASGRISFTQFFMDKVLMGNTLEQCFLTTKENLKAMGLPYSRMMPQMHCLSEKLLSKKVGGDFSIADASPVFVDQSPMVSAIKLLIIHIPLFRNFSMYWIMQK
jgi:hypothetical protein